MMRTSFVGGFDVYEWPEFRAFCARLGLPAELPPRGLLIDLPYDGDVLVLREDYDPAAGHDEPERMPQDAHSVYHWPEFRALAARLGLAWELPTQSVILRVALGHPVRITQAYLGRDLVADLPVPRIIEPVP